MSRQPVNQSQTTAVPVRQFLFVALALLVTLAAGQFYYSLQTARLADQVAAQTALLSQIQATRANNLVRAADPQSSPKASSPATVQNVVPQDRWVF